MKSRKTAVTLAVGSALAASLAAMSLAHAAGNPFALQSLSSGYQVAEAEKKADSKSEGQSGASKAEGEGAKTADGKDSAAAAGSDHAGDKKADGKCGEGKCGASKK